jgi:DNA-directed RNA polymerase
MKKTDMVLSEPLLTGSKITQQIDSELLSIDAGVERYRKFCDNAIKRGEGANLKPAERLCMYWFEPLEKAITAELNDYKKGKAGRNLAVVGPLMSLLSPDKLAVITMHEALGHCMDAELFTVYNKITDESTYKSGVRYSNIAYSIGRSVMAEMYLAMGKKTDREAYDELMRRLKMNKIRRVCWWAKKNLSCEKTSRAALTMLGDNLLSNLMTAASCGSYYDEDFKPAFFHEIVEVGIKDVGFFGLTEDAWNIINDGHEIRQKLRPKYAPMVVTPLPWQEKTDSRERSEGGYMKIRTPLISKISKSQKDAINSTDLSRVFDALNSVCVTSMRINLRMLNVLNEVWKRGGNMLGIPPANNDPLPDRPSNYLELSKELRKKWRLSCCHVHRRNIGYKSQRKNFLSTIATAEAFANEDCIYFPHQMDYRGRCYPIPQAVNHQGADHQVALVQFSNGIEAPLRELFIHASNCYGNDKVSYDDREAWGHQHMKIMLDCAANPHDNNFWTGADKPFQFLAACMALLHPEDAAHLPVGSDGTCNGLQHYAAMLRDPWLGGLVNLSANTKPQSIYTIITDAVVKQVQADTCDTSGTMVPYMEENNIPAKMLLSSVAKMALPFAIRKIVKQPVMTDVYGVTHTGARLQVQGELAKYPSVSKQMRYPIAYYLSKVILSCIGSVCQSARGAMSWIRECANLICLENRPLSWVTELGLPVVQPHRNKGKYKIETIMQQITLAIEDASLPVARRAQVDGSAPNVLHSLDSTHMLYTAMKCRDCHIDFAATHDRFFSHAATKQVVGEINRKQFVRLHESPYLLKLRQQWVKMHPDIKFPDAPKPGDFDINLVLTSPYFFN